MLSFIFLTLFQAQSADLWPAVDERFQKTHICESYIDGAEYLIETNSCTRFGCDKWQYTQKTYCDGNKARIDSWKQGQIFSSEEITLAHWQQTNGNLVRSKALFAQSYGNTFRLTDVKEISTGALEVNFEIVSPQNKVIEKGLWLLGEGPAIPTILSRKKISPGFLYEETTQTFIRELSN